MDSLSLSQIALMCRADLIAGDSEALAVGVSKDTRQLKAGELYVALKGDSFDGNDFILEAAQNGAMGAICDGKIPAGLPASFGILRVADGLQALTALAAAWREQLSLRSILLTGSSGKTTTKDFSAVVLRDFLKTTCTQGNFNNQIGLPLSILRASRADEVAVWEIGMNHRGEIAPLAKLGRPDIAIITNIGTAHIGYLGSQEAIAQEKGDLVAELSSQGVAILPAADPFCEELAKRTTARIVRVGVDVGDLQARALVPTAAGTNFEVHYQGKSYPAFLPVIGAHMVSNALLALAAGIECGVPLEKSIAVLQKIHPSKSRLSVQEVAGITLIDDSYNANPDSMEAALKTMKAMPCSGRRIAVLGRMGELGAYEKEGYQRVGKTAATTIDALIIIGSETAAMAQAARDHGLSAIHEVEHNQAAVELLSSCARAGDLVLVKGSLSAGLKEVVDKIKKQKKFTEHRKPFDFRCSVSFFLSF